VSASRPSIDCDGSTGSQVIADLRDNPFLRLPRSAGGGRHRQNGGRLEIGTLGAIRSERRAASDRNGWAAYVGIRSGTLEKDKPPILGLIQRGGKVILRMLANVQQAMIKPIISAAVAPGTLVHTDEYGIYARLPAWGYRHKTVCHAHGEYARDEDGDGFCEVHVNTMEMVLVATAFLVAPAPEHLAGQAAGLSRLLPVRAQRAPTRQSPARRPHRKPGCVTEPSPPRNPIRAFYEVIRLTLRIIL